MNNSEELGRAIRLLEEIRDNQRAHLERQAEVLALQKEQFQLFRTQHEKAQVIQDRAAALQEKSADLVERGRKLFVIVLPIIAALLLYLGFLLFFR